jgi:hypothetical protein
MSNQITASLYNTPLVDKGGIITRQWQVFFRNLTQQVDEGPTRAVANQIVTGRTAAISSTPFPTEALSPGVYRVSYYVAVMVPAGVSSSVQVAIAWTDSAVSKSAAGIAVTGNTTASTGTGTFLVRVDQATPISYSTSYASNPGGAMSYDLVLTLEAL